MDPIGPSLDAPLGANDPLAAAQQAGARKAAPDPAQLGDGATLPSPPTDPARAEQAWSAHRADPLAQTIEQRTRIPDDSYFSPDAISLDDFYAEAPAGTRALDAQIEQVGQLLREIQGHLGRAAKALQGEAAGAGTQAAKAQQAPPALAADKQARLDALAKVRIPADLTPAVQGELRQAVGELAIELAKQTPDPQTVARLAERCDRLVLEAVAGRDPAALVPLAQGLGRSTDGAGALGNLIPEPLQRAAKTPPGYERLEGARDGFYLSSGARGPEVEALQRALTQAGYGPLEVNGRFGPEVDAAIRRFQRENGCAVDGIVGPETMGALDVKLGLPRRSGPGIARADFTNPSVIPPGGPLAPGRHNRRGALEAALSQIGVREASGNNDGVPAERYSGGREVPWCANFVSWAFRQAGTPLPGNQWSLGSVDYMMNQMKQNGVWFDRGAATPQPGDVIFFGQAGDGTHVGIVERVENGRVYTVEGNAGNRVARRSYPLDHRRILGYGRP